MYVRMSVCKGDGNIAQIDTHHACVTRGKPFEIDERKLAWAELCSLPLCRPQSAECETNRWCTVAPSHCYNAK